MSERAIVVGGGIAGMTAASQLRDAGYHVTLVEAGATLGGLAAPWKVGEIEWDRFYHVILASDIRTLALLTELDLEREIVWSTARSGMYANGRLHPFSGGADLLRFPGLSVFDKFRFALTILHGAFAGQRDQSARDRYDDVPVLDYLLRWSGKNVVNVWWRPLLRAKLGDQYGAASAAFIRATIARLFGASKFGFVRGGYKRILDAFEQRLRSRGVEILLDTRVREIADSCAQEFPIVVSTNHGELHADRVIVTTPSPIATKIAPLDPVVRAAMDADRYVGVVCFSVVTRASLGEYYVTNIADSAIPFTGVINMSALVDGDPSAEPGKGPFGACSLTYVPKYALSDDAIFQQTDEDIARGFLAHLAAIYPNFDPSDVLATRVARAPYVFPFPDRGRVGRVAVFSRVGGRIAVVNAARLLSATLNVNDTMTVIEAGVREVLQDSSAMTAGDGERIGRETTWRAIA